MKKLKLLKTINAFIFIGLIAVIFIMYLFVNQHDFSKLWYIVVIAFYSFMLYFKYILLGSDNVLWFALNLTFLVVYMILFNYDFLKLNTFPLLVLIPSLSSLIVFLIYKNSLHLELFILFLFIGMPLFLISYNVLNVWVTIGIELISILSGIGLMNVVYNKYKR